MVQYGSRKLIHWGPLARCLSGLSMARIPMTNEDRKT